uniref:Uncharacterized protein n=1 Tax=Rhizophora mucronata TaxID=61149 RepID=A0A2P2NLH6_RHIMU
MHIRLYNNPLMSSGSSEGLNFSSGSMPMCAMCPQICNQNMTRMVSYIPSLKREK